MFFLVFLSLVFHARAAIAAQAEGKSLNVWVSEAIAARQAHAHA
jgi:predicted HicB family RNase H-like nuclease